MIQKPSKKIISLMIVVIAIISGILIVKFGQEKIKEKSSLSYDITDINAYNSENASTTDDSQNLNNFANLTDTSSSTDTANASDLVARSLYSGYLSLSDSGDTSAESKQNLAVGIASQVANSFTYKVYTAGNIKTLYSPTKTEISFFASSLATIQNNILYDISKESMDPKGVKLKKITQIYKDAASNIADLSIPIEIATPTLDIINNYSIVSSAYDNLDKADSNPVMATIAIRYFQEAEKSQKTDVVSLANYFQNSGIIFTSEDTGNYWRQFLTK